jgi:hypothetical protein
MNKTEAWVEIYKAILPINRTWEVTIKETDRAYKAMRAVTRGYE